MRREAILGAAHGLFVEKGFEATTLSNIVRRSGGSLATLYDMFENKLGLLRVLETKRCAPIARALDSAMATDVPHDESLRAIAEEMLDRFLDPKFVGLFRIVVAQCTSNPDLGRQIYDSGPVVCQARADEFFARQMATGAMATDDPMTVAKPFSQIICVEFQTELVFGLPVDLDPSQRAAHDHVLPILTRAFAPTPP